MTGKSDATKRRLVYTQESPVMEGTIGVYRNPLGDGPIGEPPATASSVSTVRYIGRVGQNVLETPVYGDFSSQAAKVP